MAKPRITFNDGTARTLQSDWPDPLSRFRGWIPDTRPLGDTATAPGGRIYMFQDDGWYGASFVIPGLAMGAAAGSSLDIANKLKAWLMGGGDCAVYTEDALGSTYASCGLMPGTVPDIVQTGSRVIEYSLKIALVNRAAAEMICHYS